MKKTITTNLLFIIAVLFFPSFTFASQLIFETASSSYNKDDHFPLYVYIDTQNQYINAIEGKIVASNNVVEFVDVSDGDSSVNFWIKRPTISNGVIEYSGLTPGGIIGKKRLLFTIETSGKSPGNAIINTSETLVLQNDGNGTKVSNTEAKINLQIDDKSGTSFKEEIIDNDSPESFNAVIAHDPNSYDGKHFVAFATQDKISGIDHYEVKEGFFGEYEVSDSPYLIKDQSLNKKIYVKAIDKNGNVHVSTIPGKNDVYVYVILIFVAIIILITYLWGRKRRNEEHFL